MSQHGRVLHSNTNVSIHDADSGVKPDRDRSVRTRSFQIVVEDPESIDDCRGSCGSIPVRFDSNRGWYPYDRAGRALLASRDDSFEVGEDATVLGMRWCDERLHCFVVENERSGALYVRHGLLVWLRPTTGHRTRWRQGVEL